MAKSFPLARTVICALVAFWLHRGDDDRHSGINDNRRGYRILRSSRRGENASSRKHQRQSEPGNFNESLHSESSVAIRSDFKNRTSWGVIERRGAGFLSFSSERDS